MYMLIKFEDKHPFKTMKDMANSFAIKIQNELEKYDELVLLWDVYKQNSLKKQTRLNRLKGNTHTIPSTRQHLYSTSKYVQYSITWWYKEWSHKISVAGNL